MMLRRRMPRPAPSATCTPSSSGPRYTICSHIWCTRASVILLSRVALTTPAIPHMVLIDPFELDPVELDPVELDPFEFILSRPPELNGTSPPATARPQSV